MGLLLFISAWYALLLALLVVAAVVARCVERWRPASGYIVAGIVGTFVGFIVVTVAAYPALIGWPFSLPKWLEEAWSFGVVVFFFGPFIAYKMSAFLGFAGGVFFEFSRRRKHAPFMRARLFIIAAVAMAGIAVGAVALSLPKKRDVFSACGDYLTAIDGAARLWANDNGDRFPPDLLSMSNEVVSPKMYVCPGDHSRQPAASWASFTPEQSSFEVVTPSLRDGDTNRVYLRCKIHGSVVYGDGSVFVHGQRHYKH